MAGPSDSPDAPGPGARTEELQQRLEAALGAPVEGLRRLSGGASRETWAFDLVDRVGDRRPLILRRDPPGRPGPPGGMGMEARALRAAHAAGLPVPAVLADDDGHARFGAAGLVMERIEGEAIARRILRDDEYRRAREVLAAQCGACLARLHSVPVGQVPRLPEEDALTAVRLWYDQAANAGPASQVSATFEWAFQWLDRHRPPPGRPAVVHGDFRLGNLMVGPEGLRAVLDWELVHVGDPLEDLGWLCTKAWRFGGGPPVGGVGDYDQLIGAYEAAGGRPVDREALHWWEVFGTLRWGVICMGQAAAHLLGAHRSVELAAIGRRVCEQEWDLLELLQVVPTAAPEAVSSLPESGVGTAGPAGAEGPHGRPTAEELLVAVQEFLQGDAADATTGRVRFHTRVAANVVAMVARELALGPAQAGRYAAGLARLGVASEAELATAVRLGQLDHRRAELGEVLAATVRDRLAVANPRHLGSG
jgi:aminoglycoside phosphotransferase (APT) family kinase protein